MASVRARDRLKDKTKVRVSFKFAGIPPVMKKESEMVIYLRESS